MSTQVPEQTSYLLGLVGSGIGASLTPAMQEREGRESGLRLSYQRVDADRLGRFPEGYRHLAYLQSHLGFTIKGNLPGLRGAVVETLYAEGRAWLAGSDRPGDVPS